MSDVVGVRSGTRAFLSVRPAGSRDAAAAFP